MLDLLVLALVLGHGLGLGVGLARVLEALLHRAEELAADVVGVLQRGDDVGRRGDRLEEVGMDINFNRFTSQFTG